jgi:hypothetical protein
VNAPFHPLGPALHLNRGRAALAHWGLAAALVSTSVACSAQRTIGVGARDPEPFERLLGSPLLLDLPAAAQPTSPAPAPPAPRIAGDELVELRLRGTALAEAVHLIADAAAVNIYLEAGLDQLVDANFPAVTLDGALGVLLGRNGLRLVEEPAGVFWVERADGSEPALEQFRLEHVRAADVAANVQALAGNSVVVVDTDRNVVLVRGQRGDAQAIGAYLRSVDYLKPQVLIEVHLFEVSLDDRFEFGLDAAFSGELNDDAFQILSAFGTEGDDFALSLDDDDGDFSSTLNALRRYVGVELLSSPKVLAVTNTEARVEIVTEIPYVETTSTTSGTTAGVGATVQESVEFKEAGLVLTLLPTVQGQGVLQVQITQELSEVIGEFNAIPVLDTRTIASQFLVQDRQTIVLGGLAQVRHSETDRGIPGLMHVPWLGRLFQSDDDQRVKRELLLFVTPRVLAPNQAAALAPHFRSQYREQRGVLERPVLGSGAEDAR